MRSRVSSTAERGLTGRRPTEKWRDFTAPWLTNGPTPVFTPATPSAATNFPSGCTPTITTAATPHSAANHPPAAYLTSQVSTARSPSGPRSTLVLRSPDLSALPSISAPHRRVGSRCAITRRSQPDAERLRPPGTAGDCRLAGRQHG